MHVKCIKDLVFTHLSVPIRVKVLEKVRGREGRGVSCGCPWGAPHCMSVPGWMQSLPLGPPSSFLETSLLGRG